MPFCPLGRTPMVSAFRSCSLIGRKPHPSQMKPNCPFVYIRTESCWKEDLRNSSVALIAAISQVSTWYICASGRCVGVPRAMALIGNARQATSGGKSGTGRTNRTGGYGPDSMMMFVHQQHAPCVNLIPRLLDFIQPKY